MPIEVKASRIPQSGQMSVLPSVRESAGRSVNSLPHKGQMESWLCSVVFIDFLLAVIDCFD